MKHLFVEYFLAKLPYYLIGAYAASFAEYKLNYNLYDLTKDKIASLFHKKS
jgi:hypothetical protein